MNRNNKMRQGYCFVVIICCCVGVYACPSNARTLKCDDGVVHMNDSKYVIAHKCGEPTYKDFSQVSRISETSDSVTQRFVTVEDWLYNFGPSRFVIVLTFENDQLIGMRKFGKGRSEGAEPDFRKKVDIGDPTVRLLLLYGPPSYKEERVETTVVSHKDGVTIPKQRSVETWTYNLGPNRFLRIYNFIDGRLVSIRQGDKGF